MSVLLKSLAKRDVFTSKIKISLYEYRLTLNCNCKYKDKGLCLYIQGNYISIVILILYIFK